MFTLLLKNLSTNMKNEMTNETIATPVRATVSECSGGKWFVCVNQYLSGIGLNPKQAMKSFATENEALAFAKSFNPDKLSVERSEGKSLQPSRANTDWRGGYIAD